MTVYKENCPNVRLQYKWQILREWGLSFFFATHYVPTKEHYPEIYADSPLNEAFAQDLADFIVSNPIDYWIYGHHHFNQPDFKVGNTQLLTNQLGYVMREEHEGFDWEKCIEV